jgi:hypothetical protein
MIKLSNLLSEAHMTSSEIKKRGKIYDKLKKKGMSSAKAGAIATSKAMGVHETLDPVGHEDADVNNDGKVNSQDKYIMKHRAAIAKAMAMKENQGPNGEMAKAELRSMLMAGSKLYQLISPEDELPGWIAAYITLASDYIHSVKESIAEEEAEESEEI